MEKFNINNKIKRQLAREVKSKIGSKSYTELVIMYKPPSFTSSGCFYIDSTPRIELLLSKEDLVYKIFTHHSKDGNLTLKDIEDKIFGVSLL